MSTHWRWFGVAGAILILALSQGSMLWLVPAAACALIGFIIMRKQAYEVSSRQEGGRSILVEAPATPDSFIPSDKRQALSIINSDRMSETYLPQRWDESAITMRLAQLRVESPNAITHYLSAIYERFIIGQEQKTVERRISFVQQQIRQLKLAVEWQQTMDNLDLLSKEKLKRATALDLDVKEISMRTEEAEKLHKLNLTKKELEHEVEIARLKKQLAEIQSPTKTEDKLSPEQERAKRHAESEARLAKLKEVKQASLKIDDEQERVLKVMAIDDEIQREMVEWSKTLP